MFEILFLVEKKKKLQHSCICFFGGNYFRKIAKVLILGLVAKIIYVLI